MERITTLTHEHHRTDYKINSVVKIKLVKIRVTT